MKDDLNTFQPDALILVDYGGFNMKIAAFAKEKRYSCSLLYPSESMGLEPKASFEIEGNH